MSKISELPTLDGLTGAENTVIERDGVTYRTKLDNVDAGRAIANSRPAAIAYGSNVSIGATFVAGCVVSNGAVTVDETGTTGVPGSAGGWKIPAGRTGAGTRATYAWRFAPKEASEISGQKVRLSATLQTSSLLLAAVSALTITATSDAPGQILARGATQIDDTHVVVWVDYLGAGTETKLELTAAVPANQVAAVADISAVLVEQTTTFLGLKGGGAVTNDLAIDGTDRLPEAANLPDPVTAGGATIIYGGNLLTPKGLDVQAGSTGNGSTIVKWVRAADFARDAGDTVRVSLRLTVSDFLLDPAKGFFAKLATSIDGVVSYANAVPKSAILTRPFRNVVQLDFDYVVRGAVAEYVGIQAGFAGADTSAKFFIVDTITFRNLSKSAAASRLTDKLRRHEQDSGELVGRFGQVERYTFANSSLYGRHGLLIGVGQSGLNGFLKFHVPAEGAGGRGGSIMSFTGIFDVPDDIPTSAFYVQCSAIRSDPTARVLDGAYTDGGRYVAQIATAGTAKKIGSGRMLVTWRVALDGTEEVVIPFIHLFASLPNRAAPGIINLRSLRGGFQASAGMLDSASSAAIAMREGLAFRGVYYTRVVTVKPDGTGDYPTLKAALAAIGPGESALRRTKVEIYEGTYTDIDHQFPANIDAIGIGRREYVRFDGALPANWTPADIQNHQTFFVNRTNKLANLTVTCRNMRYPVHSDSGASSYMAVQEVLNCHIEHYGNQEAVAYQVSLGATGNPSAVWASGAAWGMGMHSGMVFRARESTFKSLTVPFFFHTNADFAKGHCQTKCTDR